MATTTAPADRPLSEATTSTIRDPQLSRGGIADRFDFIVCGAGSAGSAVAGMLALDPSASVLLIEAGGSDETDAVLDPDRWMAALGGDLDWSFQAEPDLNLNGRAIPYSMGKVLGGGGGINVGIWSRGHKADWDYFAEVSGDSRWGYDSVSLLYQQLERRAGERQKPGIGAGVWIRQPPAPHPFFAAVLESMAAQGIERFDRLSGPLWEAPNGCAYVDENILDGVRQSPFRCFVGPRRGQTNITVLTGAVVTRVLFQGRRANGVQYEHDGVSRQVWATDEVVLSLGAIHTPKILMLSGIGDEAKLKPLDIPVLQHLPGVGQHLHDHVAIGCVWDAADTNVPTAPRGQVVAFWKTDPTLDLPNALAFANPIVYATPENAVSFDLPASGWSMFAGMASNGNGDVSLTGRDPNHPVRIRTGFLSKAHDLHALREVVAMCRRIGNGEAMQKYARREAIPGNLVGSKMDQFLRNGAGTFWHQSGTAGMGTSEQAVVDACLRVRGVEGLRIADASIMPRVTVGNTMAPSVVIGLRCAEMLQADRGRVP